MPETTEINTYFALAIDYVNTTNEHLYLTGKAGTGKTTFLKYIKDHCHKKLAIAAPTGVAAMNAGGVTLHSLFQLPLGSFIPEADSSGNESGDFFDRKSLLKHLRLNKAKRELLQELELLIIDEVSMLRCDLLDAIDTILKSIRRKARLPFGGVQVLFIGDLFQLPPVIRNSEWHQLRKYYTSPSFFSAKVLSEFPPIYLELKNIYRQSDENFIRVLNNIRHDEMTAEDLDLLNAYYKPDFKPEKEGEYIILTTHNNKADIINRDQLAKLSGTAHSFKATISGDFNENNVTAETELKLKEGAQVMFIRNDKGEKPKFYNGKIGVVKSIKGESITVTFQDNSYDVVVEKETWENKRYKLNKETDILEEDVKGTFTQYPIRLAWAITIHKSQGLTFDKAIIDAGDSFAAGQVYVALSRLTSLNGLVLHSKISGDSISSDASAVAFSKQEKESGLLKEQLEQSRVGFIRDMLLKGFDWRKLTWTIKDFIQEMEDKRIPEKEKAVTMMANINKVLKSQQETANKFSSQLNGLLEEAQKDQYEQVHARMEAAANYFSKGLKTEVFDVLEAHYKSMKVKTGVKKYLKEVHHLMAAAKNKHQHLKELVMLTEGLTQQADLSELFGKISAQRKESKKKIEAEVKEIQKPKVKGESQRLSLQMFQDGKTVEEIATTRSLSPSTIEGHIVSFIGTELKLSQFMSDEKAAQIRTVIDSLKEPTLTEVKAKLGDEYSYSDVRAVQNNLKAKEKKS